MAQERRRFQRVSRRDRVEKIAEGLAMPDPDEGSNCCLVDLGAFGKAHQLLELRRELRKVGADGAKQEGCRAGRDSASQLRGDTVNNPP
jgi:hypothetical protein